MNQRKNIWIAKGNMERFEAETNKSGLVNALLKAHYRKAASKLKTK